MTTLTYDPTVFDVKNMVEAKSVILTVEDEGISSSDRWELETPYLAELAETTLGITKDSLVLDYGCGIGRMARGLIARTRCRVIGVDISSSMRALAASYTDIALFAAIPPEMMDLIPQVDAVLGIWVFQHIPYLHPALQAIKEKMKPEAKMLVVNQRVRCVPTVEHQWVDDGVSIPEALDLFFKEEQEGALDKDCVGPSLWKSAYWRIYSAK